MIINTYKNKIMIKLNKIKKKFELSCMVSFKSPHLILNLSKCVEVRNE